jgi:hypothetical protein
MRARFCEQCRKLITCGRYRDASGFAIFPEGFTPLFIHSASALNLEPVALATHEYRRPRCLKYRADQVSSHRLTITSTTARALCTS